ncbi:glycoside hydrolase/deacetylase [Aspergillus eucalypticola CBS 122712]|uniref:Glycoside hydrolase/deacetylase n=1 Tax=Aspergillus eucalypticola (strain CBS 122712 / IBT 29274) TaxID=1448314 RepID=A0A317UQB9_ASPEC|nr:glycoside hydrolase/deacetylase [Aspergillus eucalypticola CBS 122712]PWY64204.1 glycoside hydrolase/deacetylase [Aspergillus eucalypticola CBS 122712]
MADRQSVQHSLNSLLSKLSDPDPDMRYMSLNDLLGILNNPNSTYLAHDQVSSSRLAEGLLKALDDQHGDVQNQALKCLGPLVLRLPFESLASLLEKLTNLTASQTIDTSVPNTALRYIVTALPRPQPGQPPSQEATMAYSAVSRVLIPRLTGPTPSPTSRRGSIVKGMLEKDPSKGFSSDAIDVLIQVVTCFGPLLKEPELTALQNSVLSIVDNDTAGTVVTKRALTAISALVLHFSDAQLSAFVQGLVQRFNSPQLSTVHRRHLIATVGGVAKSAPAKFGPHLPTLAPYVFAAVGEDNLAQVSRHQYYLTSNNLAHGPALYISHQLYKSRCLHYSTVYSELRLTTIYYLKMHMLRLVVSGLGLVACTTARNIFSLQPNRQGTHLLPLTHGDAPDHKLVERDSSPRCGPDHGKCPEGKCCSTAGNHCSSPDCQIDFGNCDAHTTPGGPPTDKIPRPHVGNVPYGPKFIRSCTTPGTIALTFDDGPKEYTQDLLDLLDKYEAKVTFFVTGNNNAKGEIDSPGMPWASLIQRMYRSGHQVASHTWSHQDLSKVTQDQRRVQLLWNEVALRNILGTIPTYMRPPYSSCTAESGCLEDLGSLGYHVILYDIDTEDYSHDSPALIQQSKDIFDRNLAYRTDFDRPWLVIAHDVHEQTVHNLTEYMLKKLIAEGYRAVTVGECLGDPPELWYRKDEAFDDRQTRKSKSKNDDAKTVSVDGMCGGNITCLGSRFGPCCSGTGFCGSMSTFCGSGCRPDNAGEVRREDFAAKLIGGNCDIVIPRGIDGLS